MRTTLNIDEDVLRAARELAALRDTTIGKVLSELARMGLRPSEEPSSTRNGVPLLLPRDDEALVTMDLVNRLRDEEAGPSAGT